MTYSDSSDEDYVPIGFNMLSINSKKSTSSVMAQKIEDEDSELPSNLQYYNLLTKAMDILNKNREEENEKLKLGLCVVRKNRKTFINVVKIAKILNRQPEHLCHFISKSLLAEGSINKEGQMVLSGSFLQSTIEKSIRHFIDQFVICKSCESVDDTYIAKENKLFFLKCDKCKGSKCVGSNVEGFTLKENSSAKSK